MRGPSELWPASATRRRLLAATALLPALAFAGRAAAQAAQGETAGGTVDFLFVQTAKGMAFDAHQNRLTLRGVSPVTVFFTDRPERIAGNMKTEHFLQLWSEGTESFLSDPPNADLSVLDHGGLLQTVVVLQDPVLEGEDLHYTVKIIDGDMPVLGDNASLFIDIRGIPRTLASEGVVRHLMQSDFNIWGN